MSQTNFNTERERTTLFDVVRELKQMASNLDEKITASECKRVYLIYDQFGNRIVGAYNSEDKQKQRTLKLNYVHLEYILITLERKIQIESDPNERQCIIELQ